MDKVYLDSDQSANVPMRPIICDCCQIRIDDSWNGPAIEVKVHNGVDTDVSGDYCVDCAGDIADSIRSVIEAEAIADV